MGVIANSLVSTINSSPDVAHYSKASCACTDNTNYGSM